MNKQEQETTATIASSQGFSKWNIASVIGRVQHEERG